MSALPFVRLEKHLSSYQLALLGYNMVMLYTEDTYQLPDEPFFGYQRGAYSKDEIRAIVDYAATLNIEIVPCIQTLGHLEKILRHGAYAAVKDTGSVLLVGEEKTYALIEKMIRFWKEVSRSGRIHIGMDETHDLGRGRYLDRNGYRHGFDLFNEHLARVVDICKKHGLEPMIWSDMYFRLGCQSGTYYDPATVIPDAVVAKIPGDVELVYWDYYHDNKAFYLDWIERHRAMGKEPLVGSGIWTWNRYWYDHRITAAHAGPCIEACREAQVRELFFTMWGDNGAYCDHDSAFAGMAWCADKAYGVEAPGGASLSKRFAAVCGGDYEAHLRAAELHGGVVEKFHPEMWADPLFENPWRHFNHDDPKRMAEHAAAYDALATDLARHGGPHVSGAGDLRLADATARALAGRYALIAALLDAYKRQDKEALKKAAAGIGPARESIRAMAGAFRTMWLNHNKREGLETIQARFGMLDARYQEMQRCVQEYLDGTINEIAEWEA
jgi:hexosaminidase